MTRQKVSFGWKVERVGSRTQVVLDGRAECEQVSEDMHG